VSNTTASDTFCTTVTAILPPPVSAFSSQDSLLQVSFSDSSQNAVNWQWNFGDGNTDTVPNPSHTYLVSGSYLVCLVTENACGTRDTLCQTVVVNCPLPQPNFLSSTSQLNVSFLNLTPGTTGSSWDFGDGNTSTQQSPSHTYTACGTYNVCLMSSNSCGFDTTCRMVTIALPSPVAQYSSQNTALQVSFSDSSQNATSWLWSFGDGGTSNTQNPIHAYATCDSFQVCLISSNACASDTSCQTIDFRPAEPSITQFTDTLVSSTASSYQWYLNGVPQVGDTLPEFIPTTPGYYQVAVVDSNGCPSISDSLFVNPISTSIPAPQDAPQVFPNPTSGELIVAFPRISTGRVEVWSALGKMVMQRHTASQDRLRLDLSPLADGIYHLKIEFESRWTVYKIALQR
jgi:PKD repeat protein